jgi:3-oxoacyl-[acyl-carrier-protein] synthase-1
MVVNVSNRRLEDDQAIAEAETADPGELELPSGVWQKLTAGLIDRLAASCGFRPLTSAQHVIYGGHTGFIKAIEIAAQLVQAGLVARCIVGAIDSLIDPPALRAAFLLGFLREPKRPIGFIPGEVAGFMLIESQTTQHRVRRINQGRVAAISRRHTPDSKTDQPAKGKALARVIEDVLTESNTLFIGDLNGQESRGIEWGYAQVHLTKRCPAFKPHHLWLPAQNFGEVGAASGVVAACMALRALQRDYAPSRNIVAWLSSEVDTAAFRIERWD